MPHGRTGCTVMAWPGHERKRETHESATPGVLVPLFDRAELLAEGYLLLKEMSGAEMAAWVSAMRSRPAPPR